MTDDRLTATPGQETGPLRCMEIVRTDRGWERCHRDEHDPSVRHHVRDRSWLSTENTPRLRLGEPRGAAFTRAGLPNTYPPRGGGNPPPAGKRTPSLPCHYLLRRPVPRPARGPPIRESQRWPPGQRRRWS